MKKMREDIVDVFYGELLVKGVGHPTTVHKELTLLFAPETLSS